MKKKLHDIFEDPYNVLRMSKWADIRIILLSEWIDVLAQSEFYAIFRAFTTPGITRTCTGNDGDNSHMQQTPNPRAHGPWDTPCWMRHSYVFMHIPWRRLSSDRHSSSTGTGKKFSTAQNAKKNQTLPDNFFAIVLWSLYKRTGQTCKINRRIILFFSLSCKIR